MDMNKNYILLRYPKGRVNHKFKFHPLSPFYLVTACGETCGRDYPIKPKKEIPMCKKCAARKSAGVKEE